MPDVPASPTEAPRLHHEVSLADITERLMVEFGDRVPVSTISATVLECRHDLHRSPVLALPELVERLARQCLVQTSCAR